MVTPRNPVDELDELRREFDHSFVREANSENVAWEQFLAFRVAKEPFAVALPELMGVFPAPKVVGLPGNTGELLGIAGHRGQLVPVYCLARLLGFDEFEPQRQWMAICRGSEPLAVLFESVDYLLRISRDDIVEERDTPSATRHGYRYLREAGRIRPVIDIPAIHNALRIKSGNRAQNAKES